MADKVLSKRGNRVTVHLDGRRLYTKRPGGRGEYYVGPGEVTVPRHIAEAWGLDLGSDPPWEQYDEMTAEQIVARAEGISDAERTAVIAYETAGKARKTVLEGLGATPVDKASKPSEGAPAAAEGGAPGDGGTGGSSGGTA